MGFKLTNFTENETMEAIEQKGEFFIFQPKRFFIDGSPDSISPRPRKVVAQLQNQKIKMRPGALEWMVGDVQLSSGIQGAGDLVGKFFKSKITGSDTPIVKPEYSGTGVVVSEPLVGSLIIEDLADWNGALVIDDGNFVAASDGVQIKTVFRDNVGAILGAGEVDFKDTGFFGTGRVVLQTPVPRNELITIDLENDMLKVDGDYAIAWSNTLQVSVEKSTKSLLGSGATGEGLLTVFRGTGRVILVKN